MLINYQFSNFRSVGTDPVSVSFEATNEKREKSENLPDNLIKSQNLPDTLKGIFIFGNNGSGKTSVISSFGRLQEIILFYSLKRTNARFTHALFRNEPSTYKVAYSVEGTRYDYSLTHLGNVIIEESLYYSPNGRTTKIFERDKSSFSFGSQFDKAVANCEGPFREYKPLLSVANDTTRIESIQKAYSFFESIITFTDRQIPYSIEQRVGEYLSSEHPEYKEKILSLIRSTGSDIQDIIIEQIKDTAPTVRRYNYEEEREKSFFDEDQDDEEQTRTRYEVSIKHPQFILPITNESNGTLNLFRMAIALCRVTESDKILLCDEPETSMHPNIVKALVSFIMSKENKKAQIFCATHATELLNLELLRRDQLYFASINPEFRNTVLERLSDIGGIRLTEKVEQHFLDGAYNRF